VCEDAGAGGYEAFPDVCRLQDGRLISVFYAGYGHVALPNEQLPLGGRVSYCLSTDEGRTWTAAQTLYDGPDDDRDPSIVQLKNGRIICNYFTLRKAEGKNPPWDGLGTWMVYSDDNLVDFRRLLLQFPHTATVRWTSGVGVVRREGRQRMGRGGLFGG